MRYGFFPATFVLPGEYGLFLEDFKKTAGPWIMKPTGKAQVRYDWLATGYWLAKDVIQLMCVCVRAACGAFS